MLTILGIGAAYPATVLTNQLIEELSGGKISGAALEATGIRSRCSALPLEYLRSTGNIDPKAGEKALIESPSDLALRAALTALARAGVSPEQVGLILGDACSPIETTPSEAQRLGARLNVKANAYDLLTGGNALVLQLATLDGCRAEKLPDVIVCISANTPTQQVNYRTGEGASYFGDAATAVVVSPRLNGRLTLREAAYSADSTSDLVTFETYGHLRCEAAKFAEYIGKKGAETLRRVVSTKGAGCGNLRVIPPQFDSASNAAVVNGQGVQGASVWTNMPERGYTVGAAALSVLADRWDDLKSGDDIAVVGVGGGSNFGHALFRVE